MPRSELEHSKLRDLFEKQQISASAGAGQETLFETRLGSLARMARAANLEGLVTVLRKAQPASLQRTEAEAKTITETSFFRDLESFEALERGILPRLIAERRPARRLRVWAAACSTGQEAYSLALLLVHGFSELAGWDLRVVGTDLSDRALERAFHGRYRPCELDRGLPEPFRERFFDFDGDAWTICDEVRRLCEFRVLDLAAPLPAMPLFDLILLRNVLLYLPPAARRALFAAAHAQLAPGGYLMLGAAEQAEDFTHLFAPEPGHIGSFYRPVPIS